MIELKNVQLNINGTDILTNINFCIEYNSVTAFIGNKNTGKSTLLKLLSGIYKNYSGEIFIDGKDLTVQKSKKIDIVHDKREKNIDLTVIEYLLFYSDIYNVKKDKNLENFIDSMLKRFALMSYKYTSMDMLDLESFKLIDVIRVLIHNPDIILFDNLFFSDNDEYNDKLIKFLKTIIGSKTLIFAARTLKYIEDLCDNIGVFDSGNIIAFGDKETIYRQAELNKKIQVEIVGEVKDAIDVLNKSEEIYNVTYDESNITFSIKKNDAINSIDSEILKRLIDAGVMVSSYRKEEVKFEQLLGKLKG